MNHNERIDLLLTLNKAEIEVLRARFDVPSQYIPQNTDAERGIAILEYCRNKNKLAQFDKLILDFCPQHNNKTNQAETDNEDPSYVVINAAKAAALIAGGAGALAFLDAGVFSIPLMFTAKVTSNILLSKIKNKTNK